MGDACHTDNGTAQLTGALACRCQAQAAGQKTLQAARLLGMYRRAETWRRMHVRTVLWGQSKHMSAAKPAMNGQPEPVIVYVHMRPKVHFLGPALSRDSPSSATITRCDYLNTAVRNVDIQTYGRMDTSLFPSLCSPPRRSKAKVRFARCPPTQWVTVVVADREFYRAT